ncbi:MAG TPA: diguanylate cyclase [Sphaerochaeta sp.]|nr:diguanylate cyclase [Sphaerochaeta sp.]
MGNGGRRQAQDSLFVALLQATLTIIILELSVDLLSGRTFNGSRNLLTFVSFWFYVVNPIPGALYLLYLDQLRRRWVTIPRGIGLIVLVPIVLNVILNVISLFNGSVFTVDSNNFYQRGPLFFLVIIADFGCLFLGFVYLLFHRDTFKNKDFSLFLFFPIPVLIGSVLQATNYGIEATGISLAITLLIIYLQMQNSQANKDYLTHLYNRSLSEQYLNHLINRQKKNKAIGGIMMDINCFKKVNDTYGHDLGDKTLRQLSKLLVDCFGSNWFIGRYGGDEFIFFRLGVTKQDIEKDLASFHEILSRFNAKEILPFSISISSGFALYEIYNFLDGASFIKELDRLMYENKRGFHCKQTLD